MDETAVWADMASETTVECRGAWTVGFKTTGHEKVSKSKMKPMIVFGGEKMEVGKINEEFRSKCIIASPDNAWMN